MRFRASLLAFFFLLPTLRTAWGQEAASPDNVRSLHPLPGNLALYAAAGLKAEAPLSGPFSSTARWEMMVEVGVNF